MRKIILLSLMATLSACSTPYKPDGLCGGYSEFALQPDVYTISFKGNGYTSSDKTKMYALRRAAELTLEKGYRYFVVLDGGTNVRNQIVTTPGHISSTSFGNTNTTGFYGAHNFNAFSHGSINTDTTFVPPSQYKIEKYSSSLMIKMFKVNKPGSFDAKFILSNFQDKK